MVFNSLGSNYDLRFVLKVLFATGGQRSKDNLVAFLNKKYGGETVLVYKGREAIKLALDLAKLPKSSKVGINGFTCYVVYKAVVDAGYTPELIDIDNTLNFSLSELKKHHDLKALIIQNTLGVPCDMTNIKAYCLENKIILIEDLAHNVGLTYPDGQEMGTRGDFTALSFSQDKMLDAISGGALVIRNKKYNLSNNSNVQKVSIANQIRDRLYPLWTYKIRITYGLGIGKALHYLLKKLKILSQPLSGNLKTVIHDLPGWYSSLAMYRFSCLDNELNHRRKISEVYAGIINTKVVIDKSAYMRFSITVDKRGDLINYLTKSGIHVSDIWYDVPIAPRKLLNLTNYNGECPVAKKMATRIVNLPTHINVSVKDAKYISNKINIWLNTH